MRAFAALLDRLVYTPGRNAKLTLLADYFRETPDPDRGWALAALTDSLPFSFPVRRTIGQLMEERLDPELFRLSRDYVGDTAETVALVWQPPHGINRQPPTLGEMAATLELLDRNQLARQLEAWLDTLDATGRWACLKFLTGALRVGVSARLAKTGLARAFDRDIDEIEEIWFGVRPPYAEMFAWLKGEADKPDISGAPVFRPMMLAHPLEDADWDNLDLRDFVVEWKWDGIRVQVAATGGDVRLYSRTGDDIGQSFPDILESLDFEGVLDGELLVVRDGEVAPFNDLQQRLNRKTVSSKMMLAHPAHVRFYDALMLDGEDLRALPLWQRRERLETWYAERSPPRTDLSEQLAAEVKADVQAIWSDTRENGIEGLMLKRRQSPYLQGRPRGHWYKWKRAPLTLDCVIMYAQRGSGRRSSYHSDFTFGAWRRGENGDELVPVGKAYSGFTDKELVELDRWVRRNTTDRFGPVRAVTPELVVEVEFDAVQRSTRHKSGVAMRFPRFHRIRWDKPAAEADRLETLVAMIPE
jgi:DNA ligase-1